MTAITDNGFARVGKETIIRNPSTQGALTWNDIAYDASTTIKEKVDSNYSALNANFANINNLTIVNVASNSFLPPSATWTEVPFDAEVVDMLWAHDLVTNTWRLTIQTNGYYIVSASWSFQTTPNVFIRIKKNWGATPISGGQANTASNGISASIVDYFTAGTYLTLEVYAGSGWSFLWPKFSLVKLN